MKRVQEETTDFKNVLKTRANAYPRLNELASQEKKKRLDKLAQVTDSIRRKSATVGIPARKEETQQAKEMRETTENIFGRRGSLPRTPPPTPPPQPVKINKNYNNINENNNSFFKARSSSSKQQLGSPVQTVMDEANLTIFSQEMGAIPEAALEELEEEARLLSLEEIQNETYPTYEPSSSSSLSHTWGRKMTPDIRTTTHIQGIQQATDTAEEMEDNLQQIKWALQEMNDKITTIETRVTKTEEVQLKDRNSFTSKQEELHEKMNVLTSQQEQGFATMTQLLLSLQTKINGAQQEEQVKEERQSPTQIENLQKEENKEPQTGNEEVTQILVNKNNNMVENRERGNSISFFSQHKPDKPEKFDGKVRNNALEKWVQLIENYAEATKMSQEDLLKFAVSNLKEQAADWWLATTLNLKEKGKTMQQFEEMKAAMRLYFTDHASKSEAISKLRVLQERTSVSGYTQEFLRLRILCPEISEAIASQYFVEGLGDDIRPHVALRRPATVDEAVELAVVAATSIRKKGGNNNNGNDRRPAQNTQGKRGNFSNFRSRNRQNNNNTFRNTKENRNDQRNDQRNPRNDKSQKTCHYCKKPGHLIADCRKKATEEKGRNNSNNYNKRPIRKNNIDRYEDAYSEYVESNFSDYENDATPTFKVNCLSYEEEENNAEKKINSSAYEKNQAAPDELITLIAHINGRKARILVDSGAGGNFISEQFAKTFRIRKNRMRNAVKIQYADKRTDECEFEVRKAQLSIGRYSAEIPLIVAPLAYDAILGKPWLTKENPEIDWKTNKVWVIKEDTRIPLPIKQQEQKETKNTTLILPMSFIKFRKDTTTEGTRTYLITIRDEKKEEVDPCLTSTQPEMARKIMSDYPTVFCNEHPGGLPQQTNVQHTIELEDETKPPCRPLQLMSQSELAELRKQLDVYLEKGWIKPSDSPYGAPVLFALKKDGTKRMCIDYRALNKLTKKSKYPLPRFEELQAMIGKANLFSKIDLSNGYHQVRMAPQDTHKTAFRTRFGQYEWQVMPFGLTNAPATFQRLINNVLQPLQNKSAAGILDDILIFTTGSKEKHDADVREVVELLKNHHLIAKPKKCSFFEEEVEYWGHIITKNGWTTEKSKIETIKNWPCPLPNVHAVRSFLGMCAYYRRYVQDFTKLALPLYELVRKEGEFLWTKTCEQAMDQLKERLTTAPVLKIADHSKPFVVTTDASHYAIGAVLQQYDEEGNLRPIAFESRKLKINRSAQKQDMGEVRYPTHEKEMLAIVHAAKVWRHLLLGNKVTFLTDHMPLKYLQKQTTLSDRQIRWVQFLEQYNFEIQYKPGKENVVADALSRRCDLATLIGSSATDDFLKTIQTHYQKDRQTKEMFELCKQEAIVYKQGNKVFIKDDMLCVNRNGKILTWIPTGAKEELLRIMHDESGHPGKSKLAELIRRRFWWPQMTGDINRVIRACDICERSKSTNQKPQGLLQPLPVSKGPWERITIDLITELPTTHRGNDAILTVTDTFTKYVYAIPTAKTATARTLADLIFEHVLRNHGVPATIVSDRDPRFISDFWKHLWTRLDTKLAMSTAFHPQTDGQSERTNRTIIQHLRTKVNEKQEDWDLALPLIQLHINNLPNESTGFAPHFANYAVHPRLPPFGMETSNVKDLGQFLRTRVDTKATITDNIQRAQNHQKEAADKKRRPCEFTEGQLVMLSTRNLRFRGTSKKLAPRYIGPFRVRKIINGVTCKLELPETLNICNAFHSSLLKVHTGQSKVAFIHPGFLSQALIEEFEVESILQHREDVLEGRRQRFFLIKWKNADITHSTWEPEGNLANAKRLLREYLKKNQPQKNSR